MDHIDSFSQNIKRKKKQGLKDELKKSHVVSDMFYGMILILLEKLVELEFACPCNPYYNAIFASAFFLLPGILSFVLMIRIRGYKSEKSVLLCCSPAIIWLILTFLDGQYFACAMTYWSGSYRIVLESAHQKWCKPDNTSDKSEELLRKTAQWFCVSQVCGMFFIILEGLVQFICSKILKQESQDQGRDYQDETLMVPQVLVESENTSTQGSELSTVKKKKSKRKRNGEA